MFIRVSQFLNAEGEALVIDPEDEFLILHTSIGSPLSQFGCTSEKLTERSGGDH
jgi:hypothetical protein